MNWGRTWIRTRAVELGLSPEFASIQLGHLETVGYPFSNASPTVPKASVAMIAPHLEIMARLMGWRVRAGIPTPGASKPEPGLLPLQDWSGVISAHEAKAKEAAKQWRREQTASISTFRQRAEQDVLSHPVLVARGTRDVKRMANVEDLPARPFLELLGEMGLPTRVIDATGDHPI